MTTGEEVVRSIHEVTPTANIVILPLDLASFDSIRNCADTFNRGSDRLDILFLNAGVCSLPPATTQEGFEFQFGVNHMGHALLTQLLLPKMLQTRSADPDADLRIHVTSSDGATVFRPKAGLQLALMKQADPGWHTTTSYGHSKLANALFARKLSQVYPFIYTNSSHPGTVKSDIYDRATGAPWLNLLMWPIVRLTGVTTQEGAKTQLWCATVSRAELRNGSFYKPMGKVSDGDKMLSDQLMMDELWEWTSKELESRCSGSWPSSV